MEELSPLPTDLKRKLEFLLNIPYLETEELDTENQSCFVCLEPYQHNGWREGDTFNRPVRLQCGHTLDIQCLARYLLSTRLDRWCPLCQTAILSQTSDDLNNDELPSQTAIAIIRGGPDALLEDGTVMPSLKEHVYVRVRQVAIDEQMALGMEPDLDRSMMLMEECFSILQREQERRERKRQRSLDRERLLERRRQRDVQAMQRLGISMQEPFPKPTSLRVAIAITLTLGVMYWYPLNDIRSSSGTQLWLDAVLELIDVIYLLLGVIIIAFDPPRRVLGRLVRLLSMWSGSRFLASYTDLIFQASLPLGREIMERYSRENGERRV